MLSFCKHKKDDGERSKKCASGTSHLSNKPTARPEEEFLFRKIAEREAVKAEKGGRTSCAENYRTAANSFFKFLGKSDIPLTLIKPALMKRYEQWLWENGISHNTSSCYMRSLRAIYNKVVRNYHVRDRKPFDNVFTGNDKTMKRAVEESDITRIASLDLKTGTRLCLARDLFMFCFYAMGMPFVDVAHLKKSQIKGKGFKYYRQKTDSSILVGLEPCAMEIVRRYDNPESEFVFPILKGDTTEKRERSYQSALGYYNILLKKVGKLAGISEPLTSYVARHSWASLAYERNVGINVISQALGHSSPTTTIIYIRELNQRMVFGANKKVLRGINKTKEKKETKEIRRKKNEKDMNGTKFSPLYKRCNINCRYAVSCPKNRH